MIKTAAGVIVALLSLACASCTPAPPHRTPGTVPFAYYVDGGEGGDMSELDGTLTLKDGCLTVVATADAATGATVVVYLPVFPYERTTLRDEVLELSGEVAGRVGGTVQLTGGISTLDSAVVPDGCPAELAQFIVANN